VVLCLPYLGTGASLYRTWPRRHRDVETCPIQLPGRESRIAERSPLTYEALASLLADELVDALDARPVRLFGHCASAYLAIELADALADRGREVDRVFVSSMVAPHESGSVRILDVSDDDLDDYVLRMLAARGADAPPDVLEMLLEIMRDDLAAYRRYDRGSREISHPVTALRWLDDADVEPARMDAWAEWGVTSRCDVAGDHWAFLEAPGPLLDALAASQLTLTGRSR